MKTLDYMKSFDKLLRWDENLLRLLRYKANNMDDNIFTNTSSRPNIVPIYLPGTHTLDPSVPYFVGEIASDTIRHSLILSAAKAFDASTVQECRLIFAIGGRSSDTQNYLVSKQDMMFQIQTHVAFENVDYRQEKICDYINKLIFNQKVTGLNKAKFVTGYPTNLSSDQYIGYTVVYRFGSAN
jgi:hypothetical protein